MSLLEVHKPHVLRSLTLSMASPGPYSAYRSNMIYFYFIFIACDGCALCVGFLY
jgi:hypothetical protein